MNLRSTKLALSAAVVAAIAFAAIAASYLANGRLVGWDLSLARWLADERSSSGMDLFRAITLLGSPATALAITAVACIVLYRRGHGLGAAFLPVSLAGVEILNLILKLSFHRPRPEVAFVQLDTYSFPSGHAMISTAAYGTFAYFLWGPLGSRVRRVLLATATVVLVALIGFSRLYLGVHYLSDVLAGVAGGVFWLGGSVAVRSAYRRRTGRDTGDS